MNINPFKLEEYLTQYEFSTDFPLCCSDAESFKISEIVGMANKEHKTLWDNATTKYTEPHGHPLLLKAIASTLYNGLNSDHILCFAGAEEGIFTALSVLCDAEDNVIVLTPCYQSLSEIPKLKGASVTLLALQEENQWRIDIALIKKSITAKTKCIIINFPHNPTGQVITEEELRELISLCDQHGIWLFADEVYRLLGASQKPHAQPAACLYEKAISLGVMSKAFGMAGLRIGWVACQDKIMLHKMKNMKDYLSICNSAPSEILSIIALSNKESILARNNAIVSDNLKLLDAFFMEYEALFEWVKPQGGCVGFVKYKGKESVDVLCETLVKKKNVLLMPASVYNLSTNHFRIGFGRKNMGQALHLLKEFIHHEPI